jgi:hypothetical protein
MTKLTPLKAIRMKCLDCSAGQPSEVRRCCIADCPLFRYRFGRNPSRKGIGGQHGHVNQKPLLNGPGLAKTL